MSDYCKYVVATIDNYGTTEIVDSYTDESHALEYAEELGASTDSDTITIVVYKALHVGVRAGFTFAKVK